MGGMDTVGKASGDKVVERVRDKLQLAFGEERGQALMPAVDPWTAIGDWSPASHPYPNRTPLDQARTSGG